MYKPIEREAQLLRRYDSNVVLGSIAKFSAYRRSDPKKFAEALAKQTINHQSALRDYQLAFVTKLLLHFYNRKRLARREFEWQDLSQACGVLTKHQGPNSYTTKSPDQCIRHLIRIAYQQFPDFYAENDTMGRTRLLYKTCAREIGAKIGFDIDLPYKEATGLSFDKSWDITLAIFGLIITENKGIYQGPINAGELTKNISDSDIALFVDLISLTPDEFQEKMRLAEYNLDYHESFNPNPLVNWPMIRLSNDRWAIPIVPYLFRRGTEQAFYDLIKYKDRDFSGFFGQVFEEYTDRILSTLGPDYEIFPETKYEINGKSYSTCDRIIIRNGDAVLIECKTKRLGLRTKFTADKDLLRRDLTDIGKDDDSGNVVHAIRQLHRTKESIKANSLGLEELNRKITGEIFSCVLVLDPYYFVNAPYIKNIVSEELDKGDYPVRDFTWQILDTHGFEPLCALSQNHDFIGLIKHKFSSPEFQEKDMNTFIDHYVQTQQIDRGSLVHPIIKSELDALSDDLKTRYGANL